MCPIGRDESPYVQRALFHISLLSLSFSLLFSHFLSYSLVLLRVSSFHFYPPTNTTFSSFLGFFLGCCSFFLLFSPFFFLFLRFIIHHVYIRIDNSFKTRATQKEYPYWTVPVFAGRECKIQSRQKRIIFNLCLPPSLPIICVHPNFFLFLQISFFLSRAIDPFANKYSALFSETSSFIKIAFSYINTCKTLLDTDTRDVTRCYRSLF